MQSHLKLARSEVLLTMMNLSASIVSGLEEEVSADTDRW